MNESAPAASAPESYYAPHEKIYPREIAGRFARLRTLAAWVLLGIFYLLPWIRWGDRQAVLFDLPARKFYVGGIVLWPQDFIFLTWLLVIAALSLFFFTAIAGRLWCGYACPQTVWTEAFLALERFAEGTRGVRMKLDKGPWTPRKILRKGLKQFLWIVFALWTGFTFVGYFTPVDTLGREAMTLSLGPWETFWTLFYGFATYGNAGYLREQVCKYMCPYARFQSAMFDQDTLIVTYDGARGEPRGARRREAQHGSSGLGDCIDCTW
ncbi:MAG: 4Fe-4S dicluster domain-containing protein, partial [Steroidobacteraceae bacterium]